MLRIGKGKWNKGNQRTFYKIIIYRTGGLRKNREPLFCVKKQKLQGEQTISQKRKAKKSQVCFCQVKNGPVIIIEKSPMRL